MRVGLFTLGCDKNTVDNEYLAGILEDRGCDIIAEPSEETRLDAAVVLTCGFIADAKEQSIDAVMRLAGSKAASQNPRRLFVAGCLAQRHAKELLEGIPEIDGIVGVGQFERLAEMIIESASGRVNDVAHEPRVDIPRFMRRAGLDALPYAFLKIADGCNHACSFCSIPLMKGRLRSVPPEILLQEARDLLSRGTRELNLVAQDISVYGMDRWRDYRLPDLLEDLCAIEGDFWIRCLYCYPGGVTDKLLQVMVDHPKIIRYLDIPLQHFDSEILGRMDRPSREVDAAQLVRRIRAAVPGIVLRTTMLVGFPGETARAHRRMIEAIRQLRVDWLGAFMYSREEDTPAAKAPHQVRLSTKQRRWEAVMAAQAGIAGEISAARVGTHTRVLIERFDEVEGHYIGRSPGEAPEVDGNVFVKSPLPLSVGQFADVIITSADVYDVYARPL